MEIKVGDYIRTKLGYIIKVEERTVIFNMGYKEEYVEMESTKYGFCFEEEITKHSSNIIDLVEVGDIVEIIDVLNVDIHYIWNEAMLNAVKGDIKNGLALGRILTKEQFKANCYKVGGEEE